MEKPKCFVLENFHNVKSFLSGSSTISYFIHIDVAASVPCQNSQDPVLIWYLFSYVQRPKLSKHPQALEGKEWIILFMQITKSSSSRFM